MAEILEIFDRQPKWLMFVFGVTLVATIGYIHHQSGEFAILFFYFIPIALVIWYVGCWHGSVITILSSFVCCIADYKFVPAWDNLYWDSITQTVFLIFVAYIISALRYSLKS